MNLVELPAEVLGRALLRTCQPALSTLSALRLATLVFLRGKGVSPALATY